MGRKSIVKEYINKVVGGIKILKPLTCVDGRLQVECLCLFCKRNFIAKFHNVYKGTYKSCGCLQHAFNVNNPKWDGYGEISKTYFWKLENGAKKRHLEFDLTIEQIWELFIKQDRKCALTGEVLEFKKSVTDTTDTASLDRIDSSKGYIKGNIQWIHKDLNFMKQDFTEKEFLDYCYKIIKYRKYEPK